MNRILIRISFILLCGTVWSQAVKPYSEFKKTIFTSAVESGDYTTLTTALKATELDLLLDSDGPFTIFAPSDRAFHKWSSEEISSLMRPENKHKLREMLTYFMVAGSLSASKILNALVKGNGKASFTTVQGKKIRATIEGVDIILTDGMGNKARITTADTDQCNGIIHTIDSVILPKPL
ncbi:Uncaracterized surface protein containing fasciclin (FAS1) repeats [Muriicola jejuensis]|uniref:Fasciclin domain-containing protein n=1 Tax=Muriicola jejuensis TaxID=504488 RepID=A0A6P0ULI5_9FLAO|nr:fasciclin domain-containing protein [Muriicola jejuensis]NER11106.1 fasciclin domain-containing protein [Muriicola jejuensis]SMP23763.1 Uncaracterized surface protein containing fasciclin (FAS1) repeats [Muriicola jejuensis]